MTPTLNVRLFCSPVSRDRHVAALSSLPTTYSVDADGPVDIAVADETQVSIAAARNSRPRALAVENAGRLSLAAAQALADHDVPVFPLLKISSALNQLDRSSLPESAVLVRSHLCWQNDLGGATIEHLVALADIFGQLSDLQLVEIEQGYAGRARTGDGIEVALSGQVGAPSSRYELDVLGLLTRIEVYADLEESGNPVSIRVGSGQGFKQPQGIYENHLRLFWRSLGLDRSRDGSAKKMSGLLEAIALLDRAAPRSSR